VEVAKSSAAVRLEKRDIDSASSRGVDGVKSAARVLSIIRFLTTESLGATFAEIYTALDLPKSSAYALLATMIDQGFLTLDSTTRKYRIGVRIWEAGQAYVHSFDLPGVAMPFLEAVRDALHETVQLATLDGIENVYVAKVEADQRLILRSRVGTRLPAYSTGLGKVLLAGLDDEELRRRFRGVHFQKFTERSITDFATLYEVIQEVRVKGFGVDNGEYTPGVVCVAVPVRDHSGRVVSAMSVSVPEVRSTAASRRVASEVLLEQAGALSQVLGYAATTSARKTVRPRSANSGG
jgi:DNA-binding IclR family transcriptional regulator